MTDTLVERLRAAANGLRASYQIGAVELIPTWTMDEAADRIIALEADVARLREAVGRRGSITISKGKTVVLEFGCEFEAFECFNALSAVEVYDAIG